MTLTINEEILKENNLTKPEFLLLLASFTGEEDVRTVIERLIDNDMMEKNTQVSRTDIRNILVSATTPNTANLPLEAINEVVNDDSFIRALMQLFPENGLVDETTGKKRYFRKNTMEVKQRLKRFILLTGVTDKYKIYDATCFYTSAFGMDYAYMTPITSFILKTDNDNGAIEHSSMLLTCIETIGDEEMPTEENKAELEWIHG
ncbi:MAG: hypothetical protein LBE56_12250 [Tannerella sp.]|jgi:hypothetical protein|nr:hypothetical protein [Tannerella sp.]